MIQRNRLLLFFLSLIVLFMAIGYASINNITLSLAGTGNVDVDENVHITVAISGTNDSTRNTCLTSSMSGNSITSTCYNNDYLFITGQNQWTINKSSQGNSVVYISNSEKP